MSISIVIPSHNPEALFLSEVKQLLQTHPEWQIIIVDDASDRPLIDFVPSSPNLTVIRNETALGAGASRNMGMVAADRDYTIFADDDDFMDWISVQETVAEMTKQPIVDMAISQYKFLRDGVLAEPYAIDIKLMNDILKGQLSRVVPIEGYENLLRVTNFPWTKVYRTSFIRRIGLRFSETSVQNDIFAHWQSLLSASRILVTARVQCLKVDNKRKARINNTADQRRLQAFTALRETYEIICKSENQRLAPVFWAFYRDLVRWMLDVATPQSRLALMRAHLNFVGILPQDVQLERHTAIKRWELWDMKQLSSILPNDDKSPLLIDQLNGEIYLAEISRLKRLAAELRSDNDNIRRDLNQRTAERNHAQSERDDARKNWDQAKKNVEHLRSEIAAGNQLAHNLEERDRILSKLSDELRQRDFAISDLHHEVADLKRHVNSKAAQMAFRVRNVYLAIVPPRSGRT